MAKSPPESALKAWVEDHGPYELTMMRYALRRMRSSKDQLEYNAFFECFASKSRVLIDFYSGRKNKDKIKAQKYCSNYRPPKRDIIQKTINLIDHHALHPSEKRPLGQDEKIQLSDCSIVADWLESAHKLFLCCLPGQYSWNENPLVSQFPKDFTDSEMGPPSASNHIQSTTSSHVIESGLGNKSVNE